MELQKSLPSILPSSLPPNSGICSGLHESKLALGALSIFRAFELSVSWSLTSMPNIKAIRWFGLVVYVLMFLLSNFFKFSAARDSLGAGESLRNNETLTSAGGIFELGFFSIDGPSSNHYLGIWFKNDEYKKAVWVANRDDPVVDDSGVLTVRYDGNLVITDIRTIPIIVNYGNLATSGNTSAKILNSGNFILSQGKTVVWQSFDYPSDTFLPGMKLGLFDLDTDHVRKRFLVSWLTPHVPTNGPFALGLDWYNRSAFNVWRRDGVFRQLGSYDGRYFRFFFESASNIHYFTFVSHSKDVYLTFGATGNGLSWFVLTSTGEINEFTMLDEGITLVNHTLCEGKTVNSTGCLIPLPSLCGDNDHFSDMRGSMPNSIVVSASVRLGPSDCEIMCRSNCSCVAYASFHDDGTGCELYYGNKFDLLNGIGEGNRIIHVRGDASSSVAKRKRRMLFIIIAPIASIMIIIVASVWLYPQLRKVNQEGITTRGSEDAMRESVSLLLYQFGNNALAVRDGTDANFLKLGKTKDPELPQLSFSCILTATENFSSATKIGEGGFGPVYKGNLLGHEIAVKRLSRMSAQGLEEFRTEVQLISRLQHCNLVRLLGYCIDQEEKILIYEYMPNSSLDSVIFDPDKRSQLDWGRRLHIIEGIAQGLLYLHKYSRFRIIHRDLKTSNILLDSHFNPKISDFGLARIFDVNSQDKTKRIVGTYGYMSPEYAVHGLFSTKSDIFSFGVVMLEIVTGKKNTTFYLPDRSVNLLGYAWEKWREGHFQELMDEALVDSCFADDFILCIQVALLCVQKSPTDRPTMSDVVSMLSNERTNLPMPKQPAFCTLSVPVPDVDCDSPSELEMLRPPCSNDTTFSGIEAR